ncbi:MAG: hypothetical protein K2W96_20975 [Gemmataceae bacterium]|nr:hypothetical protein [Gemmataceae bacterium]
MESDSVHHDARRLVIEVVDAHPLAPHHRLEGAARFHRDENGFKDAEGVGCGVNQVVGALPFAQLAADPEVLVRDRLGEEPCLLAIADWLTKLLVDLLARRQRRQVTARVYDAERAAGPKQRHEHKHGVAHGRLLLFRMRRR